MISTLSTFINCRLIDHGRDSACRLSHGRATFPRASGTVCDWLLIRRETRTRSNAIIEGVSRARSRSSCAIELLIDRNSIPLVAHSSFYTVYGVVNAANSISCPSMSLAAYSAYTESRQVDPGSNRSWERHLFFDHPGYKEKLPEAWHGDQKNGKVKVWCKACFRVRVAEEQRLDTQQGRRVRELVEIEKDCEYICWYRLSHSTH